LSRVTQILLALAIVAGLIVWQLFVPPIIGLADQGDFVRMLGPLEYAPVPRGPEHKYWYVTRKYVKDPTYREPRWEQPSSELLTAWAATRLNRLIAGGQEFDIRIIGWAHALLFFLALARLLYVTRQLRVYWLLWSLVILIMTDVGYVAYLNSLYTEPASCIWFLFFLAESIAIASAEKATWGAVLRWTAFAILWITAKIQNAPLCVPIAFYGATTFKLASDRRLRHVAAGGMLAICVSGWVMYRSTLPATRVTALYNTVFFGILPESTRPEADLASLGLDRSYAQYSGTVAWSPGTGVADGALVQAVERQLNPLKLFGFYLSRPARLHQHVERVLQNALSLRPEFCGNFEESAGRRPGARSDAIAFWSGFHSRCLGRIGDFLVGALLVSTLIGLAMIVRMGRKHDCRRWLEFGVFVGICCLMAFSVAAFGDAWDNVKHQFLFNLLLDTCLVFVVVTAFESVAASRRRSEQVAARAGDGPDRRKSLSQSEKGCGEEVEFD